ncbi:amino acid adenylation domain-containing protein [Micromonospora echinospora]
MTQSDTLHSRFLDMATKYAGHPAVVAGDRVLTYGEVADRSARLAADLRRAASAPDQLVALRMARGANVPIAILGVLRAGMAYVPIDPEYPPSRQDFMLADSGARLLVDDELHVSRCDQPPQPVPFGTAYVIYTSGSSGRPKGCVVGHEHVLALFESAAAAFGLGPDDVWTVFHSHSFDFNVWELWGALLHGGTAVMVPQPTTTDPAAMLELLRRSRTTVLSQTPSAFALLAREAGPAGQSLPDLRYVVFGGEAIRPRDIQRWHESAVAPGARIANMYGITETTVHVTLHWVDPGRDRARIPIGEPLPHLRLVLRDDDGATVPDGTPGEMWVGGSSVAHGYLGRPDETAERFPVDPADGRRWYRSGDWAVRDADGELYYLGRRDNQVKIRGHRIELEEIEAMLADMPGVRAAACKVVVDDGRSLLVAYLLPEAGVVYDTALVQEQMAAVLPRHMMPHRVRWMALLPLTTNGKLDRGAL